MSEFDGDDDTIYVDGWAQSGFLATGGLTGADPNGRRTQESVALQGPFSVDRNGPGAQYYTVQFGVTPPAPAVFSAVAEVTWSVQGNDVTRRVDVVNGAVISGTGQLVKVVVRDNTSTALLGVAGITAGKAYYVDILVTPGCRPSENQPPRLTPVFTMTTGAGFGPPSPTRGGLIVLTQNDVATAPIPKGVISVKVSSSVTGGAVAAGDILVGFFISGTVIDTGRFDPFTDQGFVPIPPSADLMVIRNNNVAKTIGVTAVYGVEG